MTDVHTPEQRSYNMSRIKSRWTVPERKIHGYLKGRKIRHVMHPTIYGNPDILLRDTKTIVFLHGCFWHMCPVCFKKPATNTKFWERKINRNVKRDSEVRKKLRTEGWKSLVIWEHEIRKDIDKCIEKIERAATVSNTDS